MYGEFTDIPEEIINDPDFEKCSPKDVLLNELS